MELVKQAEMFAVPVPAAVTPMDMLDRAISSGAGIETLEKLMALQERYEKNNARRAFDAAIAAAKAEIKPVKKNQTGHQKQKFADFAAIASAVDPVISRFGLSYRFRTQQDERIHVTCVLSHADGHSEETTLAGPADASGGKNAIQAIGSTLTYLQRYSLMQALGLSASQDDDDGGGDEYDTTPWTDRLIAAGKDRAALEKIGEDIKAATDIPESALKMLRAAWSGAIKQAGK